MCQIVDFIAHCVEGIDNFVIKYLEFAEIVVVMGDGFF